MPLPELDSPHIQLSSEDAVLLIRIHRPERKNALNLAMYTALAQSLAHAAHSPDLKAVCLTGTDDCFSAGNDLSDFAEAMQQQHWQAEPLMAVLRALANFSKPLVAAVSGPAYGIGTTALLHCDAVIAHPAASFCLPFVPLGLCPEAGSSQLLTARVGYTKACEWLLGGQPFDADEALAAGLINTVNAEPLTTALQKAAHFASLPPNAFATSKSLLRKHSTPNLNDIIAREADQFARALKGPEFARAIAQFTKKENQESS